MAAFTIPSVFTAIDKMTAPMRKMTKSVTRFTQKAETGIARADRRFRKFNQRIAGGFKKLNGMLGGFGALLGGALIIGALGGVINTFKDFEQANASLSAVMGVTVEQNRVLAQDAKRLGSTTAKTATEVVGLQEAFARLGFSQKEILDVTESTIAGSIAMNSELAATAELTGAMVRTFDNFSSVDAPEILDQMTLATQKSALNFEKLNTALPIVSGAANAAGIPFTKMLSLLGKLSDAGIDASSSSTALRNIFLESAKQGLNYDQILEKIVKSQSKLTVANDEFGKRGAVSSVILAKNLKQTEELDAVLKSAAAGQVNAGVANAAAAKQLDTLGGAITILGSAYEGFILSVEDGTGKFSGFLKTVIQVTSEILSLASGSAIAEGKLNDTQRRIRSMANTGLFLIKTIGVIIAAYLAWSLILKVARIAMIAFNIVQGISAVIQGKSAIALRTNVIAMKAFAFATKIVTAAQWLWNIALNANPIGLIVIAIVVLIALITIIIKKYNEWGAALALILGPLGAIINLVQSFRRNWDMIKQAFKEGGIVKGLLAIGATILDSVLMPLQQVLKLASSIPGVGDIANAGVNAIQKIREGIGVNVTTDESGKPLANAEAAKQGALVESKSETLEKQQVDININAPEGAAEVQQTGNAVPVNVSSTQSFD